MMCADGVIARYQIYAGGSASMKGVLERLLGLDTTVDATTTRPTVLDVILPCVDWCSGWQSRLHSNNNGDVAYDFHKDQDHCRGSDWRLVKRPSPYCNSGGSFAFTSPPAPHHPSTCNT